MPRLFGSTSACLCAAYGPALVMMTYLAWTYGRLVLGRWPLPGVDDPGAIPGLWVPRFLTTALLMFLPFPFLVCLVRAGAAVAGTARWRGRLRPLAEAVLGLALTVGSFLFLRWDPHHVTAWFDL